MRRAAWGQRDLRRPWLWPDVWQRLSVAFALVVGALLIAPWWLSAWAAWADAQQSAQTLQRVQTELHHMQQRRAQLDQEVAQRLAQTASLVQTTAVDGPAVTQALTHLSARESLALSVVDWDMPLSALKPPALQQVPLRVQLRGAWPAWMGWWTRLPDVVPLATLTRLDLHAQPQGGWRAHVVLLVPQRPPAMPGPLDWQLAGAASAALGDVMPVDPMDARVWQHTQSQHAQQHPSYARWIAPELHRIRSPLEALSRERLRYVGQISQAGSQQALLRSIEVSSGGTYAPVYRVSVGDYVGQDLGRVQTIAPDQLTLRELVRDEHGVWQPRDVTLLLEEGAK